MTDSQGGKILSFTPMSQPVYSAAAFIFPNFLGQFLTDRPFSVALAIAGLIGWGGLVVLAFAVAEE